MVLQDATRSVSETVPGRVLAIDTVDLRGLGLIVVVWASGDTVYRSLTHIGELSQVCSCLRFCATLFSASKQLSVYDANVFSFYPGVCGSS